MRGGVGRHDDRLSPSPHALDPGDRLRLLALALVLDILGRVQPCEVSDVEFELVGNFPNRAPQSRESAFIWSRIKPRCVSV